jgi:hypothetical protein
MRGHRGQPYVPDALYPQKYFLVLISLRDCANAGTIVRLEGLGKLKKCNDLIGTRTGDLPCCSYRVPLKHFSQKLNIANIFGANIYFLGHVVQGTKCVLIF